MRKMFLGITLILITGGFLWSGETPARQAPPKFTDVEKQTKEFIDYNKSIVLTRDQEKIKQEALTSIAAPCCDDFTMATCCCPCNLAKSVWGLSNYLIAKQNYDATRLAQAVKDWIQFTHKHGFAGDACNGGRCAQPFANDGCGGMNENNIVF